MSDYEIKIILLKDFDRQYSINTRIYDHAYEAMLDAIGCIINLLETGDHKFDDEAIQEIVNKLKGIIYE